MHFENPTTRLDRFEKALALFVDRLRADRWIVGAVLIGSLSEETIWRRDSISLWIIESDGVTRRRRSDGGAERIFRSFVEEGVEIHAELIPRSRFKKMIEGTSRTAFTHSFFAERKLVFAADESLTRWFDDANTLATRDQDSALLIATTWAIHPLKHIRRLLTVKADLELARQHLIGVAYSLAAIEIILRGEVYEQEAIYKALELNPALFEVLYTDLLGGPPNQQKIEAALRTVGDYLDERWQGHLKPLIAHLRKRGGVLPLSELGDEFAHTQIYPWHIETACEWLADKGILERVSMPITLTTKSSVEIEEPAYELID